ncbi:HPP family protein [Leucobacter albus]|uniref:HPP family protein n=1 Tax=Leucobacter albus TaxID=272210 RepID=A0ABW3TLS6_9MICO
MSKSSKPGNRPQGNGKGDEPTPEARRKQIFLGLAVGAVMGLVLGFFTQFWLWLPAGLAVGLATGAIMKPPAK